MKILKKIRAAEIKAGISKTNSAWYRGHAINTWPLLPKLFRFGHKLSYLHKIENEIFSDFQNDYPNYIKGVTARDSWDTLCAMQHYGVSTRLLDWSTELDIALYFAIQGVSKIDMKNPDTWPCIWVLNPYRLNHIYTSDDLVFDRADPIPFDYYEQNISSIKKNLSWPHEMPIAINPGFSNQRMQAQHGRFTLQGESTECLLSQKEQNINFWNIQKVIIDPNDFGELERYVVRDPSYHLRLFPDIEGYTKYLNHKAKVR